MTLEVAFCFQDANKYVHAEEANRVQNTNTMDCNIVREVCLVESRVDSRGNLYEEQKHLRKQASENRPSSFHEGIYARDMNVLLLLDDMIPVLCVGHEVTHLRVGNLLNGEVNRKNGS